MPSFGGSLGSRSPADDTPETDTSGNIPKDQSASLPDRGSDDSTSTGGASTSAVPVFSVADLMPSSSMTMTAPTPSISVKVPPGEPSEVPVIPIVLGIVFGLFGLMLLGFWIASRRRERKNEARRMAQKPLAWPET